MPGFIVLTVRTPEGNGYTDPSVMKRVDEHLMQDTAAFFVSNFSGPIKYADGTWRVRVMTDDGAKLVTAILASHYGLEIVSSESFL